MKKALITLIVIVVLVALGIVAWNFIYQAPMPQTGDMQDVNEQGPLPPSEVEDLVVGDGKEAKEGDYVTIRFRALNEGGTELSSIGGDEDNPFGFIIGYDLALENELEYGVVGMKVGGKRRITVPPELVESAGGLSPLVPPGEFLILEVELLTVEEVDAEELF